MYITHYPTDAQRHELTAHLKRIAAPLVGVMDDPAFAVHLRRNLPGTAVFYRNAFSQLATRDNNAHLNIDPRTYINVYHAEVPPSEGVWWHFNNEPGATQAAFDHALECAQRTIAAGGKAVVLNFSTGTPEPDVWQRYGRALLEYIARYPSRLAIGLHEYATPLLPREFGYGPDPRTWPARVNGASYLLGRHRYVWQACDQLGIRRAPIMITESFFDWIDAEAEYMRSLPHDPGCESTGAPWCNRAAWEGMMPAGYTWERYMLEQIQWAWRAIYAYEPELIGAVLFCLYAQGGTHWEKYDHARIPNFFTLMEAGKWTKTGTPQPETTQLTRWKYGMKVRSLPYLDGAVVGGIAAGMVSEDAFIADGYLWVKTRNGYVAVFNITSNELHVKV